MSIASDVTRIKSAKAAIKAAIEGKGVTVPDATLLDGMAALIESIEAGGVPTDHMGWPFATGVFTPAEDITTSAKIEFPTGNRLRVKTTSGYLNRPFFILVQSYATNASGIRYVTAPTFKAGSLMPSVYAFILAESTDISSFSTSTMALKSLSWEATSDSVNASKGSDRTFTGVTIPCTSNMKFIAGYSYRYVVAAPWGYPIEKVEVV